MFCTTSWSDSCSVQWGHPSQCQWLQTCPAKRRCFIQNNAYFLIEVTHVLFFVASLNVTWMIESVRGSVMTFSRSGASSPVWMLKDSTRRRVSLYRTPVAASKGRRTSTDSQLKKSWTVAPANALKAQQTTCEHVARFLWSFLSPVALVYLRNSFLSPACITATMVLVTDVPMLAPMMIGTADWTSSTEEQKEYQNQGH